MIITMATPPAELSFDEILKFMLAHNGKVTNHELVKHFKVFLKNPDMRDEARSTFKKHVNTIAVIKNQNNEKWLILKKKYMPSENKAVEEPRDDSKVPEMPSTSNVPDEASTDQPPARPPLPVQLNQDFSILANIIQDRQDVASINAPMDITPAESKENLVSSVEDIPPKVHPRRKSSDKAVMEKSSSIGKIGQRSSIPNQETIEVEEPPSQPPTLSSSRSESMLFDSEQKISVKERKQMFNRMASESDVLRSNKLGSLSPQGVDEEDRVSLDQKSETDPLDSKQKQWILCAARGEYHALAKMCKENVKVVKTKDPFTTAMHWACKRGDENLVKLLAGAARHLVNERSGYTPLHIAMQFRHENVYRLLVEVYDADPNVRDWSGRKPRQYLVHMDTSLSPGCFRKIDAFDVGCTDTTTPDTRNTPNSLLSSLSTSLSTMYDMSKKEGFLRIGSLNVRVKKTTEAFSNFLGVGATRASAYIPKSARDREERRSDDGELHKTWGSADNIQKEDKLMPPPMSSKVRRRGASGRKGIGSHSRSTPSTPDQPRAQIGVSEEGDSDSDSAAGFHAAWRQQRASNYT